MLSLVTVSPVITAFHSCCLSHHVFGQVNLWPAWVGIETAIFWKCSSGTVETQRLYPLNHGPRTWCDRQELVQVLLYSHEPLYKHICRCMQIPNDDTIKTSKDTSLEKIYLSLYLKRFERVAKCFTVWEGVRDRTELYHIDPHSYGYNSVSFPFSWAAQLGAWGPSLSGTCSSFQNLFSNCNCSIGGLRAPSAGCWFSLPNLISNWLNFLCTELYNNFTSTLLPASVTISHSIQPVHGQGYILTFLDRMHLLSTHFLFWHLAGSICYIVFTHLNGFK